MTAQGEWKRLFPVRFRHLSGDSSFGRWDWVKYRYTRPPKDDRVESWTPAKTLPRTAVS
ncbi:MAG: hypothetical protein KDE21_12160 [Novosphingobium sp.]|nr:hypothetical protein [Novosphingobium sp.]